MDEKTHLVCSSRRNYEESFDGHNFKPVSELELDDGTLIDDELEIANHFNEFLFIYYYYTQPINNLTLAAYRLLIYNSLHHCIRSSKKQ